jgi:hypothetical protein
MFKNATFLSFYFADNQLFSNSETLVNYYRDTVKIYSFIRFFFGPRCEPHNLSKQTFCRFLESS